MSNLTELQEHLSYLKECVTQMNKVKELKNNFIYSEIIEKGFCIDEMQRCAGLAISENASPELRTLADNMSKAGAILTNYLDTIIRRGSLAESEIPEVEAAIVEVETSEENE